MANFTDGLSSVLNKLATDSVTFLMAWTSFAISTTLLFSVSFLFIFPFVLNVEQPTYHLLAGKQGRTEMPDVKLNDLCSRIL